MTNSAKTRVDEQLATESHQLQEQTIHKIDAAMNDHVYWAEKITTSNHWQFQVCLNSAQ